MRVLSIQSSVVFGHVGNSVAAFALQRLGHEVWPLPTALLAHHTGYGSRRGTLLDPALLRELLSGVDDLGALESVDAVLSGYLGAAGTVDVVRDAVLMVHRANRAAVFCLDPVLGDVDRGYFVPEAVGGLVREVLVPMATVLTPNLFELAVLTGRAADDLPDVSSIVTAAHELRDAGPRTVLITSVPADDGISLVAVCDEGAFEVTTPRLPMRPDGAGDLTAALFLGWLSAGVPEALARTASGVFAVLSATLAAGEQELCVVEAQDRLVEPAAFTARAV